MPAARDHALRGRLLAGLVVPLLLGGTLTACGEDPASDAASAAGQQAVDPASLEGELPTTSPSSTTPPRDAKRSGKKSDAKATDEQPKDTPSPEGTPDADADPSEANDSPKPTAAPAAGPTPEPTIAPPASPPPPLRSDPFDLAFSQQMLSHQLAGTVMAQAVEDRTRRAAFRRLAQKIVTRRSDTMGTMQFLGDALGLRPGTGFEPDNLAADMRTLGGTVAQMESSRTLIKSGDVPFKDADDEDFDATAIDAMIAHHEFGIEIATGTIETKGSPQFQRLAAKIVRQLRSELEDLRALRRDL